MDHGHGVFAFAVYSRARLNRYSFKIKNKACTERKWEGNETNVP